MQAIKDKIRKIEAGDDFTIAEWAVPKPEAFYSVMGGFVKDACMDTEADPMAVLMTALTRLGTYFGRDACLWHGGMRNPPKLYTCIVGRSAKGRKGTSTYPVSDLADKIDAKLRDAGIEPPRAFDGTPASGEGLAWELRDASTKKGDEGKPADEGVEDKRLFLLEEELGALLKINKREGNSTSGALRKLWDSAGNFCPITKNNPVKTTGSHLCFVGHVTFNELLVNLNSVESSNGFANRFLWVCSRRSKVVSNPKTMPATRLKLYTDMCTDAILFASKRTGGLHLSPDALALWETLYHKLDVERGGLVGNLCDRAHSQVFRIATIFALLDKAVLVEVDHLNAAAAVWQYCEDSIRYIFGGDIDPDEQRILTFLAAKGEGVPQAFISRGLFRNRPSVLSVKLQRLEEQAHIVRRVESGNGRPTTFWTLAQQDNGQKTKEKG